MDPNLPDQQSTEPEGKDGSLKTVALLKLGIVEFFLVGIVLVLLFGFLKNLTRNMI